MLTLPFHVEQPLATASIVGIVALVFTTLWWTCEKNYFFTRDILFGYFRRRFSSLEPQKAEAAAKFVLLSNAVLFSCMSIFGFSITFGIIRNGERYKPPISEESRMLQKYLDGVGGNIDINQLIEQDERNRETNK